MTLLENYQVIKNISYRKISKNVDLYDLQFIIRGHVSA